MDTKTIISNIQKEIGVATDGNPGPLTWAALYKNIFKTAPSTNNTATLIKAIQKKVGTTADGAAGSATWKAINDFIFPVKENKPADKVVSASSDKVVSASDKVDDRSEKSIATLVPQIHDIARALVRKAADAGIQIKIISGLRSYPEQDALYAQGRTKPGKIVTNAKAGFSNHNFGLAFDIGVFEGSSYKGESPKYKLVGPLGRSLGLSWGGDWKTLKDEPHYELRPMWAKDLSEKNMLTELRKRKQEGKSFFD